MPCICSADSFTSRDAPSIALWLVVRILSTTMSFLVPCRITNFTLLGSTFKIRLINEQALGRLHNVIYALKIYDFFNKIGEKCCAILPPWIQLLAENSILFYIFPFYTKAEVSYYINYCHPGLIFVLRYK